MGRCRFKVSSPAHRPKDVRSLICRCVTFVTCRHPVDQLSKGFTMSINKDQVKGRADQAVGKVKEVVGAAVGNKELEIKGAIQKNIGVVQAKVGDIKSSITKA